MKDFHDIWLLSRQFDFDGRELAQAIRLTFRRRGTALPPQLAAVTDPFTDGRQTQWAAFRDRLQQEQVPASFSEIAASLDGFLSPVVAGAASGDLDSIHWTAPGPWT